MGADYIGWRGCPLQEELGPAGFLGKLKLSAYRGYVEDQVPEEQRHKCLVTVESPGRGKRNLLYPEIVAELGSFEQGIPECADCPLSGGAPVGCYRYVAFPIDRISEELIFEFFLSELDDPESVAYQIWRVVIPQIAEDSPWYTFRAPDRALAQREEPVVAELEWGDETCVVDSAQVLASLFVPIEEPEQLLDYALFFSRLNRFVEERLRGHLARAREDAEEDMPTTLEGLQRRAHEVTEDLAEAAQALYELSAARESRTMRDLRALSPMLLQAAARCRREGWSVVVDV